VEAETALFTRAFHFVFSMIDEVEISPEQLQKKSVILFGLL
jgi:hypothetical protein